MKRLVRKADLQDRFKADLIDEVVVNDIINKDTQVPYLWEDLEHKNYDDLVNILVDSKKIIVKEL